MRGRRNRLLRGRGSAGESVYGGDQFWIGRTLVCVDALSLNTSVLGRNCSEGERDGRETAARADVVQDGCGVGEGD